LSKAAGGQGRLEGPVSLPTRSKSHPATPSGTDRGGCVESFCCKAPSEGCSLFFGLSLIVRKLHPFADDLSARLVFFHFRGFSLGLNFLDQ
jgi:hypothetical protein